MDTKLSQFDQLLKKLKQLAPFEVAEPTIFSIGSKGYYENPTTDILAFFLDDKAAHGLGTLVLEALINSLPKSINDIDCSLSLPPEREVQTQKGKRLDLLLESDEWVMVIENKIYHEKNNPFSEYENFVYKQNSQRFQGKKKFLVILSLDGNIPKELMLWNGISYDSFVHSLKDKLANHFIEQPMNKWLILLREFLLHLENVMSQPQLSLDTLDFVLDNLHQIKQLQETKVSTIQLYQQSLQQQLQIDLGVGLYSKLVHWYGYPAIRLAYQDWPTESDVVLFLDGRKGKSFCINYYCDDIDNNDDRKIADEHYREQDCGQVWNEVSDTCRCYKARFEEHSLDTMRKKVAHKLQIMDQFEKEIRPTLKADKSTQSRGVES